MSEGEVISQMDFYDYCEDCIVNDKLVFVLVTSAIEGFLPSQGFKFGQGKSQFAIWNNHNLFKKYDGLCDPWEAAFENLGYTWEHLEAAVNRSKEKRILSYIQDDVQLIAGVSVARQSKVQEWAEWLYTARPFFGVIWFTCPGLDTLAASWVRLIDFEIKIPERGKFEIHKLKGYTIYKRPRVPGHRLEYFEDGTFPKLPDPYDTRYQKWRKEVSFDSAPHVRKAKEETEEGTRKRTSIENVYRKLNEAGYPVPRDFLRDIEMAPEPT